MRFDLTLRKELLHTISALVPHLFRMLLFDVSENGRSQTEQIRTERTLEIPDLQVDALEVSSEIRDLRTLCVAQTAMEPVKLLMDKADVVE